MKDWRDRGAEERKQKQNATKNPSSLRTRPGHKQGLFIRGFSLYRIGWKLSDVYRITLCFNCSIVMFKSVSKIGFGGLYTRLVGGLLIDWIGPERFWTNTTYSHRCVILLCTGRYRWYGPVNSTHKGYPTVHSGSLGIKARSHIPLFPSHISFVRSRTVPRISNAEKGVPGWKDRFNSSPKTCWSRTDLGSGGGEILA